jgi:acyl-CoA thioesterase YciA
MPDENPINPIAGRCATTRLICMPSEANSAGDIFGGWIVSQIDVAGAIVAAQRARGRVVTVAIDSVQFHKPVLVGDVISCFAAITKIGRTSITVHVEVCAERHPECVIKVTEGTVVYVAVDKDRKPRPVPPKP